MGTRSLLGYELPTGKIYYQYMQFDGGPERKGQEFYEGVLTGLTDITFEGENSVQIFPHPNNVFFKRIQHFLNEYQYKSGHSVNAHGIIDQNDWFGQKIDENQEWMYVFTRNGDFIFHPMPWPPGKPPAYKVVIPYIFTKELLHFSEVVRESLDRTPFLGKFWEECSKDAFQERKEHIKILNWKDPTTHVGAKFEHDSSTSVFENRLKGIPQKKPRHSELSLDVGEVLAFPDQGPEHGMRTFRVLKHNGDVLKSSMFTPESYLSRHRVKTVSTKFIPA